MYRRQFLIIIESVTGGLILGCGAPRHQRLPPGNPFTLSAFLRIDSAAGSAVVRTSWEPLRNAGAAARAMRPRRLPISLDGFHVA